MDILFVPLALLPGTLLTVQVGAKNRFSKGAGGPFAATPLQLAEGAIDEHNEASRLRHDDDRRRANAPA
jgi:hypothetical protein